MLRFCAEREVGPRGSEMPALSPSTSSSTAQDPACPWIRSGCSRPRGASFLVGSAQKGPRTSPAPGSRPAPVHSRTSVRVHTAQHSWAAASSAPAGVGHGPASLGGTQQGCDTCPAHWGRPRGLLASRVGTAWACTPGVAFCGPHGSVCSPVTRHMKALLERNTKKKSKLRKKPKPYVEEPHGRASPQSPCALRLHSSALRPRPPGLSLTASGLEGVLVGGTNHQACGLLCRPGAQVPEGASMAGHTCPVPLFSVVLRAVSSLHPGLSVGKGVRTNWARPAGSTPS